MVDHLQRSEMFRKMVRESTDPQWVREQLGHPHQYSRTFCIIMACIGALALYGVFAAVASI